MSHSNSELNKLKHGDQPTDVFYPRGYVIAGFETPDQAEQVRGLLWQQGFTDEQVIVLKPADILTERRQQKQEEGESIVGKLQAFFSNMGDDSNYVEQYVDLAHKGDTFVLVNAPEEADTERVRLVMVPFNPHRPRKYDLTVVKDLSLKESGM